MEISQLDKYVFPREGELQKALPNAFIRIWNLYLPRTLRLKPPNNDWIILRL